MAKKARRPFPMRPQKPGARAMAFQRAQDAIAARSTALPEPKHNGHEAFELPPVLTVKEMSELMSISPVDIIKALMKNGMMATINNQLDYDTAAIVAGDLGYETVPARLQEEEDGGADRASAAGIRRRNFIEGEEEANLQSRPPVVTIM